MIDELRETKTCGWEKWLDWCFWAIGFLVSGGGVPAGCCVRGGRRMTIRTVCIPLTTPHEVDREAKPSLDQPTNPGHAIRASFSAQNPTLRSALLYSNQPLHA